MDKMLKHAIEGTRFALGELNEAKRLIKEGDEASAKLFLIMAFLYLKAARSDILLVRRDKKNFIWKKKEFRKLAYDILGKTKKTNDGKTFLKGK